MWPCRRQRSSSRREASRLMRMPSSKSASAWPLTTAARWNTPAVPASTRLAIRVASAMSPATARTRGSERPSTGAVSTSTISSISSWAKSRTARRFPRKPAPPVINIFMASPSGQRLPPSQPLLGPAARPVFAADPSGIAEFVEQAEQVAVIDLAVVGFMALGHRGDLDMTDVFAVLAEGHGEVAFDDLRVVEILLYLEIGRPPCLADGVGLGLGVEEVAGNVTGIDRLD